MFGLILYIKRYVGTLLEHVFENSENANIKSYNLIHLLNTNHTGNFSEHRPPLRILIPAANFESLLTKFLR